MYLYFNEKGILKEIVNDEAIRLGNNDLNHIYIYWENAPEVDSMWVKFKLPSGETTNELSYSHIKVKKVIPYDKQRDLKYFKDYVSYDFFDISIPDGLNEDGKMVGINVLAEDGLVSASVRFVLTLGQAISTLGLITFNVEKSVIQADLGINQSQFDYLLKHCLLNTTDSLVYRVDDIKSVDITKIPNNAIIATTNNNAEIEFYKNNGGFLSNISKLIYLDYEVGKSSFDFSQLYYGTIRTPNNLIGTGSTYIGWRVGNTYYFISNGKIYTTDANLTSGYVTINEEIANKVTRLTNLLVDEILQVRGQIYKGMGTITENNEVLNRGEVVTEIGEFIDSNLKDTNGKIKSELLPSYVDDILEFATFDKFPTTGETGKIYVDMENNNIYRWSGTQYTLISSIDLLELEKQLSRKANKDGYYPQMRVGLSDNLVSPDLATDETPYTFRPTAGVENVSNGLANLRSVKGNTIKWNQLFDINGDNRYDNLTETKDTATNSYIFTIKKRSESEFVCRLRSAYSKGIVGHKFLATVKSRYITNQNNTDIWFYVSDSAEYYYFTKSLTSTSTEYNMIFTSTYNGPLCIGTNSGKSLVDGDQFEIKDFNIFDLTQMFGAGNEPATVEEFRAMFPNSYYEYNPGELVNVNVTGIKSVGFNAFDIYSAEDTEWVKGAQFKENTYIVGLSRNYYHNPAKVSYTINEEKITISSDSGYGLGFPIKVIGGKEYQLSYNYDSSTTYSSCGIIWFDSNCNLISWDGGMLTMTAPINAYWAVVVLAPYYVVGSTGTFSNVCFHFTHTGYKNETYEPYETYTLHLDTSVYFPDGMKKAGSAYDELTYHKAIKRIGSVDLGTLYWYTRTDDKDGFVYSFDIKDILLVQANVESNILCKKYLTVPYDNLYYATENNLDKIIAVNIDGYIEVKDTALKGMTTAQVKQALSGVILYYELAEPVETETNFTEDWFYEVDDFGTEQWLQTGSVNIPIPHTTLYIRNLRDDIRTLPETYANKSELEEVRNEIEFVDNKYSGYAHFIRLEVEQTVSDKLLDIIKAIYDTRDVNSTFYVDNYECRLRNAFSDYYFCDIIQFSGGTINQYVAGPHSLTGVLKLEDITYTTYTHEPYDDSELRNKINELETNILGALEADY